MYCLLFVSLVLLMNSCLGASADIVMRADGSGSVTLEYRVSQMLESMGRLDGNEHWPAIPVGKADFERSVARIPGLRLVSFSAKEYPRRYSKPPNSNPLGDIRFDRSGDLVTSVKLDFKDTAALLAFLDSTGSRASLVQDGGKSALRLVLLDPATDALDADLLSLLQEVSAGYDISLSFTAPKGAALSVSPPSVTAARIVPQGKKVSFAIGTGELVSLKDGLTLEIVW
jgi:hypothetical protein